MLVVPAIQRRVGDSGVITIDNRRGSLTGDDADEQGGEKSTAAHVGG
jgi:hypothetical protein